MLNVARTSKYVISYIMTITRCLSELCYISCATWLTVKNWPRTPLITIIFSSQSCDPIGQRHGSRKRACALYPGSSQSSSVSLAKSIPALARYEKGIKNGLGQPYCLATRYVSSIFGSIWYL